MNNLTAETTEFALVLGLAFVGLISWHLGRRLHLSPWLLSAPGGAIILGGLAFIVAPRRSQTPSWIVQGEARSAYLWFLLGAVALALVMRACGLPWVPAALIALALALVATVSWLPTYGGPSWGSPDTAELRACFTTAARWRPSGRYGLFTDMAPNLVLYLPLGMALAAAMRRRRWVAVLIGAAVTVGTESYQALFTDRQCVGNDVLANLSGAVVGVLAITAVEAIGRRRGRAAAG
jgi:hypothetical protein